MQKVQRLVHATSRIGPVYQHFRIAAYARPVISGLDVTSVRLNVRMSEVRLDCHLRCSPAKATARGLYEQKRFDLYRHRPRRHRTFHLFICHREKAQAAVCAKSFGLQLGVETRHLPRLPRAGQRRADAGKASAKGPLG